MDGVYRGKLWAALSSATALNLPMGTIYAYSMILRPLEALLGVPRSALAFVFALATISFTVGMNVAPRFFGWLRAPALVALCAAVSTAGIALAANAHGLTALIIGYGILFGLGGGVTYILFQQGLNLMITRHRGLINGYIVSLYPLGAMLAVPIFGVAIEAWGIRLTLAGLAATTAVAGALSCALTAHSRMRLREGSGAAGPVARGGGRRLVFWKMCAVFFLAAAAGLMVMSQAAGIILTYGGTAAGVLIATTAITGAIAAARLAGGGLVDLFPVPVVMAGAHAFALTGTMLLTLWPGPLVAMIGLAMIGMGYGFVSGSTAAGVAAYWPAGDYGRVASRLYIAWCAAAVTLPVLAGHVFDMTGGYQAAVVIAGCGNLLGLLAAASLPRRLPVAIA